MKLNKIGFVIVALVALFHVTTLDAAAQATPEENRAHGYSWDAWDDDVDARCETAHTRARRNANRRCLEPSKAKISKCEIVGSSDFGPGSYCQVVCHFTCVVELEVDALPEDDSEDPAAAFAG